MDCAVCQDDFEKFWCAVNTPPHGTIDKVLDESLPLISSITSEKSYATISLQQALPRIIQVASLGFPCKKMCEDVMDSCGCAQQPTLEKVSAVPVTARATIGAMFILAQIIASVSDQSYVQRGFSDALFHQLLQAMLHPDVQTRITAHQIFAVILVPTSISPRSECQSFQSVSQYDSKRALSKPTSAFSSAAALFEKLGKEKVGLQEEKSGSYTSDS